MPDAESPSERSPQRLTLPGQSGGSAGPVRGVHKVFIGMAAGVGKTYRALSELRERVAKGEDALIGIVETHGRPETIRAAEGLPLFPRRVILYGGTELTELDVPGLLARRPEVVLVDELAHTNAPGSERQKRWQDVEVLLAAGITVLSTVNVQHLESLNDTVARLTGVRVRERIPDAVLSEATELVLVDLTPHDLRARMKAGHVYGPEKVDQALGNFFTSPNLMALREIALRQVASVVEQAAPTGSPGVHEIVVVAIAAEESAGRLIRRGGQLAARLHGALHVVTIRGPRVTSDQSRLLDAYRTLTVALGGQFEVLDGESGVAAALIGYVGRSRATQVVMGETSRSRWAELWRGDLIKQVLRSTRDVDVHIISRD
ncbi:sensor histidine kinase KdpD [Deinococcus detaillensis]|uniref:Sensor histidine kinase KdpD n=1 Tax=Deinococcus detaillensis TaxID=2592048 RepID=A0A553V5S1_9DEIO|nr:sensor histidine kinase KdpD [Deinococcus detaillensis]TSA87786.1 sensor histidine kinase KdpD [Deinococcus detaillensis]